MLDQQQSTQIVVNCIRAVSHVAQVDVTGTLDDAEIFDGTRVNNMVTLIVHSKEIGVPSEQHRIAAGFFNGVTPDTAVLEVIGIVRDNAIPVLDDPLEDFASRVAFHLANLMRSAGKNEIP